MIRLTICKIPDFVNEFTSEFKEHSWVGKHSPTSLPPPVASTFIESTGGVSVVPDHGPTVFMDPSGSVSVWGKFKPSTVTIENGPTVSVDATGGVSVLTDLIPFPTAESSASSSSSATGVYPTTAIYSVTGGYPTTASSSVTESSSTTESSFETASSSTTASSSETESPSTTSSSATANSVVSNTTSTKTYHTTKTSTAKPHGTTKAHSTHSKAKSAISLDSNGNVHLVPTKAMTTSNATGSTSVVSTSSAVPNQYFTITLVLPLPQASVSPLIPSNLLRTLLKLNIIDLRHRHRFQSELRSIPRTSRYPIHNLRLHPRHPIFHNSDNSNLPRPLNSAPSPPLPWPLHRLRPSHPITPRSQSPRNIPRHKGFK